MRTPARTTVLLFSLLFATCGGGHPLAGGWHQHLDSGTGMQFEFDAESNRLAVHGTPAADGTHADYQGTYELDGQKLTVEWTQDGKAVRWTGELRGDTLELQGADGKVEFHRGGAGHGH